MVRCVEFYEYWRQHPNFCGKERMSVYYIDSFIKLLDSLMERGIAESDTLVSVSERAARPIFAVKEKATYDKVVDIIAEYIKRGERSISAEDIKTWIELVKRQSKAPAPVHIEIEDANDEEGCISCDKEPNGADLSDECKPFKEDSAETEPETPSTIKPTKENDTYLKKLFFKALVCPTCIEVRNHKCTVNTSCPVCGTALINAVLKVERVIK